MKLEEMRKMMTEAEHSGHWPYALMRRNFEKLLKVAEDAKRFIEQQQHFNNTFHLSVLCDADSCVCGADNFQKDLEELENEKT